MNFNYRQKQKKKIKIEPPIHIATTSELNYTTKPVDFIHFETTKTKGEKGRVERKTSMMDNRELFWTRDYTSEVTLLAMVVTVYNDAMTFLSRIMVGSTTCAKHRRLYFIWQGWCQEERVNFASPHWYIRLGGNILTFFLFS